MESEKNIKRREKVKRKQEVLAENEPIAASEEKPLKKKKEDTVEPEAFTIDNDPYLFAEADYLKKESKWKNKQRTLVFCSRGISHRFRHLLDDLKNLMPHHKTEQKWEKSQTLRDINEIAEMKLCNNTVFLETRKGKELYLWISRVPHGPSAKFQILNVHTMGEIKMSGNALKGSRPLLVFDKPFDELPHLKLLKELFTQTFGTPRNHPKSTPFFDHCISFMFLDNKIWFRHYQISPQTEDDREKPNRQLLTEIGPRFVMEPIKIFDGSFGGETLYKNEEYMTPPQMRQQIAAKYGSKYQGRKMQKAERQEHKENLEYSDDDLDDLNIFAEDSD